MKHGVVIVLFATALWLSGCLPFPLPSGRTSNRITQQNNQQMIDRANQTTSQVAVDATNAASAN
jgi:hypothetical protein